MPPQLGSGSPVTLLAPQLKTEVLCFVTKLGSQKLGSQSVSGEKLCTDILWLPSSGSPAKHRAFQAWLRHFPTKVSIFFPVSSSALRKKQWNSTSLSTK